MAAPFRAKIKTFYSIAQKTAKRKDQEEKNMEERIYRNIWKEIGISDVQVEERLSQLISTFFYDENERLYFPVGDDMAYIEDTGNNDARTEGMSYGMMICVQLDMKEEFDPIEFECAEKTPLIMKEA